MKAAAGGGGGSKFFGFASAGKEEILVPVGFVVVASRLLLDLAWTRQGIAARTNAAELAYRHTRMRK